MTLRERRFAAIGATVASVYLGFNFGWVPLQESRSATRVAVENAKLELLQSRAAIGRHQGLQSDVRTVERERRKLESRLLPGDSPNIAGAELGKVVNRLTSQSNVELKKKNDREPTGHGPLTEISSEITIIVTIEELVDFLYAIENHQKELRVRSLTVRPQNPRKPDGSLDVRMSISGFIETQGTGGTR